MATLQDYRKLVIPEVENCRWCSHPLPPEIQHFDHLHGWNVDGYIRQQWLYIVCVGCDYQWALWKLGVPRSPFEASPSP